MNDSPHSTVPACVGIIMDGNRRWAKERSMPTLEGHRAGYEKLKDALDWCRESGVKHLIVFGFSTENWKRAEDEVGYLMGLLRDGLLRDTEEFKKKNGRVRIIGQRDRFSKEIQDAFAQAEDITKDGEYTLWLALSYGGRAELVHAANELVKEGKSVTEEILASKLWTAGMPDPDIIIRTSGEQRLSGFLPWQGVYSELFFTKSYWPAFSKEEFTSILNEFASRNRRHGA